MIEFKKLLSLPGVLEAYGKEPSESVIRFSTDTRSMTEGEGFIAIEGPSFKPMKFVDLLESAPVIVYEKNELNDELADKHQLRNFFLAVEDSVTFLQTVAKAISEDFQKRGGKLIAICGSNGKTTTKEMLHHLLSSTVGRAHCTQKNNNNHIGVPLTLLELKEDTQFCVLELGSNHPGEIKVLCDIAHARYGVTTNIGDTHLEFFGNRKNVFLEEGHLYQAVKDLKEDRKFFLNLDDEYLKTLPIRDFVHTYGSTADCSTKIVASHEAVEVESSDGGARVTNSGLTGEHNFFNMGVAMMIASEVTGKKLADFEKAASDFVPTANRSQWLELKGSKVFLDAYNANPSSMKAALKGFKDQVEKDGLGLSDCSVVLGDMNELGPKSEKFHEELGRYAKELGFEHLYFVGRFAKSYLKGSENVGHGIKSAIDMSEQAKKELLQRPRCFIKGSRSLQLESITDIN